MTSQVALVSKADSVCRVSNRSPVPQKVPGFIEPDLDEVMLGRHAEIGLEALDQTSFREIRHRCKVAQMDRRV